MPDEQDAHNAQQQPEPPEQRSEPRHPEGEAPADRQAEAALDAAQQAVARLDTDANGPRALETPSFDPTEQDQLPKGLDLLSDVDVNVTIELGRTRMLVEDVLRLAEGAVVELDKLAGDPVDVFVNERLVARGEVLVLNDNFCIRVNEILDANTVEDD